MRAEQSARLRRAATVLVVVLVVAPMAVLVVRAFADAWRAPALVPQRIGLRGLAHVLAPATDALDALRNSVVVALATTALAAVVGWPAARVIGERRLPRAGVFLLLALPLLVPQFATGTGLATWFIRLGFADRIPGLVLAHLVYVLPYVVLLLAPAFGPEIRAREEAAISYGAGALTRIRLVTLPAVLPTLAVASLIGFLVSLSQYGTSLAVGGGLPMLPLVLLPFVRTDPQIAAALSLLLLVPAVAGLAVAMRGTAERW